MSKRSCIVLAALTAFSTIISRPIHAVASRPIHGAAGSKKEVARSTQQQTLIRSDPSFPSSVVKTYCVGCHNEKLRTGGLALDTADVSHVADQPEIWEKVVRKLRAGLMPPSGARRPEKAVYDQFSSWLEAELDRAAEGNPNPGRTEPLHRLNRAEYQDVVRDVLGVGVDVASMLPADDASYGFDNIAGVLRMSPTLLERYLAAAEQIAPLAMASPDVESTLRVFHVPDDLSQEDHVEGLPLGTRGGIRIQYTFPVNGTYVLKARLQRNGNDYVPTFAEPHQLEIAVDGARVEVFTLAAETPPARAPAKSATGAATAESGRGQPPREPVIPDGFATRAQRQEERKKIDANWQVRLPISAGVHEITVAFVKTTSGLDESPRRPFLRPYGIGAGPDSRTVPYLGGVEISGPYDPSRSNDSASRRLILICQPSSVADEPICARKILSNLAGRAYRRPVKDDDLQVLLQFFNQGRTNGTFEKGIEFAIERLLVSPQFLFRVEPYLVRSAVGGARAATNVEPISAPRISDLEFASRLSFFLWSSVPDRELLDLAAHDKLHDPAMLDHQVRRMLRDPRSDALVKNFAGQWLYLRNVPGVAPPGWVFPDFDDSLRTAFRRETELFFDSIVREDRNVMELLTADYTFVNERLARHYGIPGIRGTHFRRVTLDTDVRRGLLGQGSILAVTSYPNRTSPVKRGKWILENLLGTPPPSPPPNVPSLKEEGESIAHLTMRQRMEQHRANPACASCHQLMDPLGFALENFDAVGRFRTNDESFNPIATAGVFPDGTKFTGPQGLRQVLLDHSDQFVNTVTEKLLTYALGRGIEYYDAPAIRKIRREAASSDFHFSAIVLGIVKSVPFQFRSPQS